MDKLNREIRDTNVDNYLKMKKIRAWEKPLTWEEKVAKFENMELISDMNIEYAKEGKKMTINNKGKICVIDIKTNKIID